MKVLFAPFFAGGHTSAAVGFAEELLGRGHEVALLLAPTKAKHLDRKGFIIELLDITGCPITDETAAIAFGLASSLKSIGKLKDPITSFLDINRQIKDIIERLKPDVIIVDTLYVPAITKSKIPWVSFCSPNPMAMLKFRDSMTFSLGE